VPVKEAADLVAKVAAVLAIVSFVLGLLVVSAYLRTLDVSLADPAVFKVRFVYTGAVVLGLLAAGCLLPAWGYAFARGARTESSDRSRRRLVALLASVLIPCLVYGYLIHHNPVGVKIDDLVPEAIALSIVAGLTGAAWFLAVAAAAGKFEAKLPRWSGVVALTFVASAALLFYLWMVARWVYPAIPEQYGGGSPHTTCLVFGNESAAQAKALGLVSAGHLVVSVPVLFDGTDFLVVRRADQAVVEFSKDLLAGTAHQPHAGDTSCT
jgi:hypothetical protein